MIRSLFAIDCFGEMRGWEIGACEMMRPLGGLIKAEVFV